ncbi:MAG: hypothetical protein R3B81_12840 [bacterium]
MQIAVQAVGGGVATSVEREDQDGMDVWGILVQLDAGSKDVKVRVSDGAVTQIDDGGPDGEGSENPSDDG